MISNFSPAQPRRTAPRAAQAAPAAWCLLAPGDEVSITGKGRYEIVHVSDGSAWVEGVQDGSHQLVATSSLCLLQGAAATIKGAC